MVQIRGHYFSCWRHRHWAGGCCPAAPEGYPALHCCPHSYTLLPPGGNWRSQELEGTSYLSAPPGPCGLGCPLRDVPYGEPFLVPRGDNLLCSELRRLPRAFRWGVGVPFPPGERPCPCSPPLDPKPSHTGSLLWGPLKARHSPRLARRSPSARPPWPACLTRSFHSLLRVPGRPGPLVGSELGAGHPPLAAPPKARLPRVATGRRAGPRNIPDAAGAAAGSLALRGRRGRSQLRPGTGTLDLRHCGALDSLGARCCHA